tara:strand:+ start:986 stop:1147 length:162 start_codon:yes stop_codon:yes gene_type:complete
MRKKAILAGTWFARKSTTEFIFEKKYKDINIDKKWTKMETHISVKFVIILQKN